MISIKSLCKKYKLNKSVYAIHNIDLDINAKELVFINGKSGSGKTTLLNIIGGLIEPTSGNVYINGVDCSLYSENDWDSFRNIELGFIFQTYNLIENMTVYENISLALEIQSDYIVNKDKIDDIINYVGLSGFEEKYTNELSGGECQRVCIARALIKHPNIILADEPTGNLDSYNSTLIYSLLKKISQNCIVIVVTHDETNSKKYGDRFITLSDGVIIKDHKVDTQKFSKRYDFSLDNNGEQYQFNDADINDLRNIIIEFIQLKDNSQITISAKTNTQTIQKSSKLEYSNENIIEKNLSFSRKIKFALNNIKSKKIKVIITCFSFILTCSLLFIFLSFLMFDVDRSIFNAYQEYPTNNIQYYKECLYEDSVKQIRYRNITTGEYFYNSINETYDNNEFFGIKEDVLIYRIDSLNNTIGSSLEVNAYFINNSQAHKYSINGRFPLTNKETLITDYLSSVFECDSGDFISLYGQKLLVTGIIDTSFDEKDYLMRLNGSSLTSYDNFKYDKEYNIIIVNSIFKDMIINDSKSIDVGSLYTFSNESTNLKSTVSIGNIDDLSTDDLILGRMPTNVNEVVISYSFYENYTFDTFEPFDYSLYNIHFSEYNEIYSEVINTYDFIGSQITIVGVYYNENLDDIDIVISSDIFDDIKSVYYQYYFYDKWSVNTNNISYDNISSLTNSGFRIDNPIIESIYDYDSTLSALHVIQLVLLIILFLITISMLTSYLFYSVKDSRKVIGVLRAIGVSKYDTILIYIIESFVIGLITIIFTFIIGFSYIYSLNYFNYNPQINDHIINYLYFNIYAFMIVVTSVLIIVLCSTLFPSYSLSSKKPVDVIRSN